MHYAYRLVVPKSREFSYPEKPCLSRISEDRYSWVLSSEFDVNRAANACKKLEGVHNVASFFKQDRRSILGEKNTNKWMRHVGITKGDAYSLPSPNYDYYVVNFISRSFVREQAIFLFTGILLSFMFCRSVACFL